MSFDVAVVGCGPVGALAANLFAREGLRTLVLEQEAAPHPLPRAVHLDHEAMRLLQSAGVVGRVVGEMRETAGHLHLGADGDVIRYMGTAGHAKPFGWANDYFFFQPEFEGRLREALAERSEVQLRQGARVVGLEQDASGVRLSVETQGGTEELRARFVVACDGSRSAIRKLLGVGLEDLGFEEPWLVVDAEVDAPLRFPPIPSLPAAADPQQLSVMLCDPRRPMTVVPGRGNHRRWEFMLLPGETEEEMVRPERVSALIAPWVEGLGVRLIRAATYRFHGLVARRWQVGGVFLAGDAAHQTPPFFGQGMIHGLRDVANLAWKLGLVVRGEASERLLESYQPERDPHVRAVIAAAIEAGRYICLLDPAAAAERDGRMREQGAGRARTAADLIPPLKAGVVAAGAPAAGMRFVQPRVDGALLDDVVPAPWRLFVQGADAEHAARDAARQRLGGLNVAVVQAQALADGGAISAWLQAQGAVAALVRPDFYVFGGAASAEAVDGLLEELADDLQGRTGDRDLEAVA